MVDHDSYLSLSGMNLALSNDALIHTSTHTLNFITRDLKDMRVDLPCDNLFQTGIDI